MPNYIDLFGQNYNVNNNPLAKLAVNPTAFVGPLPELLQLLDDLLSVLNRIIPQLNALFGINLPDASTLVANVKNLLRAFNLTGAQSFLEQLITALGGTGSALSDFFNAVQGLAGNVQALIDTIANALGHSGTGHTLIQLAGYLLAIPASIVASIFGLGSLGADLQAVLDLFMNVFGVIGTGHFLTDLKTLLGNIFGSSFPKQFPFTFGTSTSQTPAPFISYAQWQALIDGLVNNGTTGNTPATAIGAFQAALDQARSDISQAILDGTNNTNLNTAIAQALQAFPSGNITNRLGNSSLGADVSAIATILFGGNTTAAQILANVLPAALGGANLPADVLAIVATLTAVFGGATSTLPGLTALLGNLFGSTFPKVFPYTFGTSTSNTPGQFVTYAQFQQLVDGISNNGTTGNTPATAIGIFQAALDAARSDISQAIADGVNQANTNTAIAQVLANYPNTSVSSALNQGSLGADVLALVAQGNTALGASGTTLASWVAALQAIPFPNVGSALSGPNIGADVLAIIDAGVNGLSGGSGSGNSLATWQSLLNVIPHQNVTLPPNPGSGSVVFDANGSNSVTGSTYFLVSTISHTCGATANYLTVKVTFTSPAQAQYLSTTVTYAGNPMVLLKNQGNTQVWGLGSGLLNSAQNIVTTVTVTNQLNIVSALITESDSYIGFGGIGAIAVATGAQSSPTVTVASAVNDMVVGVMTTNSAASVETLTLTAGTNRYNSGSANLTMQTVDSVGASSVTFSATASYTTLNNWTAIAVNLVPMTSGVIGSGFRVWRNSATSAGTLTNTGNQLLPASYYDTTTGGNTWNTPDYTYTTSTNTVKVQYAGHYHVSIGVDLGTAIGFTGNYAHALLYQNGAIVNAGPPCVVAAHVQGSFNAVYCSAGDTLAPGVFISGFAPTAIGESTGTIAYFSVALANRSAA